MTMTLDELLKRPGLVFAVLGSASAAMLAGAFAFQYIGGLEPCVLCIWQRYPYGAVIALAAIGGVLCQGPAPAKGIIAALIGLAAIALFADAAIAGFHVGVEQKWWEGTQGCVGATGAGTVDALRAQLLAQKVVRCDEVAWSFLGISMAGYNMVAATGLGLFAALTGLRITASGKEERGDDG